MIRGRCEGYGPNDIDGSQMHSPGPRIPWTEAAKRPLRRLG